MLHQYCKDDHQKYVPEIIVYKVNTLVNALCVGTEQFFMTKALLYLFWSLRLWRKWRVQRRIRKLLTGGSRTSVTCIAANHHPQSIIQSMFLLPATFWMYSLLRVCCKKLMKQTPCWDACICHNLLVFATTPKLFLCLCTVYKVFDL